MFFSFLKAHETPVGKNTENVFDDAFWERLDLVVNGLDNIQARLYVDERCVEFKKPLLESGTLGTKGCFRKQKEREKMERLGVLFGYFF